MEMTCFSVIRQVWAFLYSVNDIYTNIFILRYYDLNIAYMTEKAREFMALRYSEATFLR